MPFEQYALQALARSPKRTRQLKSLGDGAMQIYSFLRVQPEIRVCSKGRARFQCHRGAHQRAPIDDSIDDLDITPEMIAKLFLRHAERHQELLPQDFPWAGRCTLSPHGLHGYPLGHPRPPRTPWHRSDDKETLDGPIGEALDLSLLTVYLVTVVFS